MHPGNMAAWGEIACRRGCVEHKSRRVTVDLGRRHGFADLPQVPARLARTFEIEVWDTGAHPVDGGPYCPAHDAVSETILATGIWEPSETILTLAACEAAAPDSVVVDFGAQIGWFTMLAASCGLGVSVAEADPDNMRLLARSCEANGWGGLVGAMPKRIGPESPVLAPGPRVALAKVDVEGAELDAVRVLWPSIQAGLVDHLLVEVTPLFDDYYPELVARLVAAGYSASVLPPKSVPPAPLADLPDDLEAGRIDRLRSGALRATVASWRQEMVWFSAPGARW